MACLIQPTHMDFSYNDTTNIDFSHYAVGWRALSNLPIWIFLTMILPILIFPITPVGWRALSNLQYSFRRLDKVRHPTSPSQITLIHAH